jgi:hypothetical protein
MRAGEAGAEGGQTRGMSAALYSRLGDRPFPQETGSGPVGSALSAPIWRAQSVAIETSLPTAWKSAVRQILGGRFSWTGKQTVAQESQVQEAVTVP